MCSIENTTKLYIRACDGKNTSNFLTHVKIGINEEEFNKMCDNCLNSDAETFNKLNIDYQIDVIRKINISNIHNYYDKYRELAFTALNKSALHYYDNSKNIFRDLNNSKFDEIKKFIYLKAEYENMLDEFNNTLLNALSIKLYKDNEKYTGVINGKLIKINLNEPLKQRHEDDKTIYTINKNVDFMRHAFIL